MKYLSALIIAAIVAVSSAMVANAALDAVYLEISSVTTGATADTVSSTAVGTIQRFTIVADSGAGVDWSVKSVADGITLLSGTNLSDTAVSVTNVSFPAVGIRLEAHGADAAGKTVSGTAIIDK